MQAGPQATKLHCKYCFDVLLAKLSKKQLPSYPSSLPDPKVPIFDELRGCIGTFQPAQLSAILGKYALISALQDNRFDPVNLQEVKTLNVGVSLLVNFQEGKKAMDWEVGRHGIIIDAKIKGREYSATFLPQVAEEEKWTRQETLRHLVRKAGFRGKLDDIIGEISLTTYESSKARLDYGEYEKMTK